MSLFVCIHIYNKDRKKNTMKTATLPRCDIQSWFSVTAPSYAT